MKLISALLLLTVSRAAVGQECTATTTCEDCVAKPNCQWVVDTNQCLAKCPAWPGIVCIDGGADAMSCPTVPPIEILPETPAPTDEADAPTDAPEIAVEPTASPTGAATNLMPTGAPVATVVTPNPTTMSPTTTSPTSPAPSATPTIFDPQISQRCPAGHVAQRETLEDGEICLFCIPEGMCFLFFTIYLSRRVIVIATHHYRHLTNFPFIFSCILQVPRYVLLRASAQVSASALQEMMLRPKRSMNAAPPTPAAPAVRTTRDRTPRNVLRLNVASSPRDVESKFAT